MKNSKAVLLDHYKNPRFYGSLQNLSHASQLKNPSCGDSIAVELLVCEGVLVDIAFQSQGCVLSKSAGSLFCVWAQGKKIVDFKHIDAECMQNLVGIRVGPNRTQCIMLILNAVQEAIKPLL